MLNERWLNKLRTWLQNLRKAKGLSQKELSIRLGISANHYSNIENGKRLADLNLSTMHKLSQALNVSIAQIAIYELSQD